MVKGPALVVVEGTCHVLGSDVSGRTIKVRAGKALPFEPGKHCRLRARIRRGGRMWLVDPGRAGVSMWRDVARQVRRLAGGKKFTVMLVGDTDTGKSTLAAYMANVALARGLVPCVIDGDIGQGDLAPPAAIGATVLSRQMIDLRDAGARLYEFVGSTSPAGYEQFVTEKLRFMLERARPLGNIFIVNTDGYARDGGVQYKLMLARKLEPDLIVCLENPELYTALENGPWQVLPARASSQASKTRSERTSRRLDQFLRHVGNGFSLVDLSRIKFAYMDRLFSPSELARPPIIQLKPENMARMFVGLGSNNVVKGFGVIANIVNCSMSIQTKLDRFDTVYLSNIRLGSDKPVEIRIA